MASRGDSSKVDVWGAGGVGDGEGLDEMYLGYLQSEHKEFAFGHAADKKRGNC